MEQNEGRGAILIYQTEDGQAALEVNLENETVWLSQEMMARLFEKDRTVIGRHIRNIYQEGELEKEGTCAFFAHMGSSGMQEYSTLYYNLEVIISVGYRVKSKRAVTFRRWATAILKEYLVKGYIVRQQLIEERFLELQQLVHVLERTVRSNKSTDELTRSVLDVVADYTYGLDTLDRYDYQTLVLEKTTNEEKFHATYEMAMEAIAATLFLWFLENNGLLYHADGSKRIGDNALVALTLLIAESRTEEMEMMVKVVVNLINKNN